jgi:hypothetical protein
MTPLQERIIREHWVILQQITQAYKNGDIDSIIKRTNDFNILSEDPEAYFEEIDKIEE